jgi:glycosyltransferase involved in cell wall biosynthesis
MNMPEISIVMPAYNAAKYITESITSVLNQTFTGWELIVVNDGATDNTAEIVNSFLSDSRILLINQSNKGVSAARNAGISAAKGRFITFLDADDAYLPENLEVKYKAIQADVGIDYVYSDIMLCDAELKDKLVEKGATTDRIREASLTWAPVSIPGFASNIMIKSTVVTDKNIYFDTNLSNCADRYFKILLASQCKGAYIPHAIAKYRDTPGSMSKKVYLLEHDELYILDRIREKNIIPPGKERRRVFAKVYLILSGSWYKDAKKTGRAIRFALQALFCSPATILKLTQKGWKLVVAKK